MSIDYYLIAPADSWPSFGALQAALDTDGAGVRLLVPEGSDADAPFVTGGSGHGIDVVYDGLLVSIGAQIAPLSDEDVDSDNAHEYAHEAVSIVAAQGGAVCSGDVLFWMGGGTSAFDWCPGALIYAAPAEHFGATAVDPQGSTVFTVASLRTFADEMRTTLDRSLYHRPGPWNS